MKTHLIKAALFPPAIFFFGIYGIFLWITLTLEPAASWLKRQLEA